MNSILNIEDMTTGIVRLCGHFAHKAKKECDDLFYGGGSRGQTHGSLLKESNSFFFTKFESNFTYTAPTPKQELIIPKALALALSTVFLEVGYSRSIEEFLMHSSLNILENMRGEFPPVRIPMELPRGGEEFSTYQQVQKLALSILSSDKQDSQRRAAITGEGGMELWKEVKANPLFETYVYVTERISPTPEWLAERFKPSLLALAHQAKAIEDVVYDTLHPKSNRPSMR